MNILTKLCIVTAILFGLAIILQDFVWLCFAVGVLIVIVLAHTLEDEYSGKELIEGLILWVRGKLDITKKIKERLKKL